MSVILGGSGSLYRCGLALAGLRERTRRGAETAGQVSSLRQSTTWRHGRVVSEAALALDGQPRVHHALAEAYQ
jgi:hypothetical protein